MIQIKLKFDPSLAEYMQDYKKEEFVTLQLAKNESIRNIVTRFIPERKLSLIGLILVNKKIVNLDYIVRDNDKIKVLPVLIGG